MKETLAGGLLRDCARLKALLLDRIQLVRYNEAELRRLDEAGRVYATPSYKDGQYLYLLHPGTEPGSAAGGNTSETRPRRSGKRWRRSRTGGSSTNSKSRTARFSGRWIWLRTI